MKNISDFLGKPVVSLLEGNIEGYIKNISFDKNFKKAKYLILFEDNEFQDEKMVDVSSIYGLGNYAITIKNNSFVQLKKDEILQQQNHINCKVFSASGDLLGFVSDVSINEQTFMVDKIILNNGTSFSSLDFISFGQEAFVVQDKQNPVKLASIKKKQIPSNITPNSNSLKVSILPTNAVSKTGNQESLPTLPVFANNLIENETVETTKKPIYNDYSIPKKIVSANSEFLIGRKTTKTIYSANNEIVVKKNVVINQKIIQHALIFNKLRELAIYSA